MGQIDFIKTELQQGNPKGQMDYIKTELQQVHYYGPDRLY